MSKLHLIALKSASVCMCLLDESERKNKALNQASCKSSTSGRATNPSGVEPKIEDSYKMVDDALLLEAKTIKAASSAVTEKQEVAKNGVMCDSEERPCCCIVISFHPGVVRLNARRMF
ncbi:hypothetical protein TRVL_09470 [Trypanosoma vivax]|nr:hypothetical protein TRVL_09470 [Trypanosoma vivax]